MQPRPLEIPVGTSPGKVSALWLRPRRTRAVLVLGHGAGAGMSHAFLEGTARALARHRIATLRYQFPYMEQGRRAPDRPAVLLPTVAAALACARRRARGLPVFVGGKSMGGRMSALAAAEAEPGFAAVRGLVLLGYPLHAASGRGPDRAAPLRALRLPMLFVQGTRDRLAAIDEMQALCDGLRPRATLHCIEGADHGFGVLRRSGRSHEEVIDEIGGAVAAWIVRRSPRAAAGTPRRAAPGSPAAGGSA